LFEEGAEANGSAKELLFSSGVISESQESKRLYNKTHGLTDPGQQKDRQYNWTVDKDNHVFGKRDDNREADGAKKTLENDFVGVTYTKTQFVGKRAEDFRTFNSDMLGKSKFRGTMDTKVANEDFVFGQKTFKKDNWNAGKCIHGDGSLKNDQEMDPDKDLGRSTLYRSKLSTVTPGNHDPNRAFGVPSVRNDIPKKENNNNFSSERANYGDDKDVYELLYPNQHATKGLDNKDFELLVTKDELRQILKKKWTRNGGK